MPSVRLIFVMRGTCASLPRPYDAVDKAERQGKMSALPSLERATAGHRNGSREATHHRLELVFGMLPARTGRVGVRQRGLCGREGCRQHCLLFAQRREAGEADAL